MQLQQIVLSLLSFDEKDLVRKLANFLGETADKVNEYIFVATIFIQLQEYDKALEYGQKGIDKETDQEVINQIHALLYPAYRNENQFEKALNALEKMPEGFNKNRLLFEKAQCFYDSNKKEESHDLLLSMKEDTLNDLEKLKRFASLGPHLLRNGNFQEGMRSVIIAQDNIKRIEFNHNYHGQSELPLEFWQGTPDCNKLIVYLEAGLGDEIINVRFLNHLKKRGIEVKLYNVFYENPEKNGRKGFVEFYQKNGFDVIQGFAPEKYVDYKWTYSQYLPMLLNLNENELWEGSYLKAGKKKLSKKKNIGLRWSGNAYPKFRNFNLKEIYESLKDLDCTFYSVQKDLCMDELKDCPDIIDLSSKLESLEDLAAYINSFDLLITCPTITCTIAGGLDKKCIVLNPCSDYYIFNTKTNQTPWFGKNMQLIRQKTPKVWSDCLQDLRKLTVKMLKD
jgi:hypothetical protein